MRGRRPRWPLTWLAALAWLAACGNPVPLGRDTPFELGALPAEPALGQALPAGHTAYANESLADLFVRLTHDLEWGPERPHLVRYEAPVRVALRGRGAAPYAAFLDGYLARMRAETGIDIAPAGADDQPANLTVLFVPGPEFRRRVPSHICVVAPAPPDWRAFRDDPVANGTRAHERQAAVGAMTVFVPDNLEPYLVRICLIEEIAQALGPANDLYGLGPSIFNDDGAHVWPTRLDYLMLRVLYSPWLTTGLDRAATRRAARAALDQLNPEGRAAPPLDPGPEGVVEPWTRLVREAFDRRRSIGARRRSAEEAVALAERRVPGTALHCRALLAALRIARADGDLDAAEAAAGRAGPACTAAHGAGDIRLARLALERAEIGYHRGETEAACAAAAGLEPALAGHGQEERLVALYALQAACARAIQPGADAAALSDRAARWGAYALGRDNEVVARWAAARAVEE